MLVGKVLILNKMYSFNGKKWDILEELKRCQNVYVVYELIWSKQRCFVSEISQEIDINRATLYKYVDICHEMNLIDKIDTGKKGRNTAKFIIVARPQLKIFIDKCKKLVLEFCNII
ncbi:hypothetical protein LCGC14_0824190 [marine sediment metagenome]|uniref:Uncharacterized protein n=1 Tax=marine sediment metagenome TaxID=412755 RepID=A0A0F9S2R9_9ZZZZ